MDLSEKYQRMCVEAGEIQRLGPPIYAIDARHYWEKPDGGTHSNIYGNFYSGLVWLPRQDQLQAMIDNEYCKYPRNLLNVFYSFVNNYIKARVKVRFDEWVQYIEQFTSMEQLWLAFVMHEKYGKVWDDNEGVWKVVHEQEV